MQYLRSLVAFLLPGLTGIVILLSGLLWSRNGARNLATRVIGHWGTRLAGMRVRISDPGNHARLRPAVFVFNHQSGVDPVLLCALLQQDVVGVAKKSLRRHPVLGPLMALADTVFVDRSAGRGEQALMPARRALARGLAVAIAPEGHRHTRLGSFREGAVQLARAANVPLVPIVIRGSAAILPPGTTVMHPGDVHIRVLAPLDAAHTATRDLEQLYHAHLADTDPADRPTGGGRSTEG